MAEHAMVVPCWEVSERWPRFCASLANGRKRCRKGTCFLQDAKRCGCPCHEVIQPGLIPCPSCEEF
jgi:hypothetical protein